MRDIYLQNLYIDTVKLFTVKAFNSQFQQRVYIKVYKNSKTNTFFYILAVIHRKKKKKQSCIYTALKAVDTPAVIWLVLI